MGLLDEAIREHLELQRLQGADPGEIARKEREALEPVLPDEPATWGGEPSTALAAEPAEPEREPVPMVAPTSESDAPTLDPNSDADLSTIGQETVEIDMREVLAESGDEFAATYPPGHAAMAPVRAGRITNRVAEDDMELEWEIAGHAASQPGANIPGQERLTFE